ncbi:type II toxin-antitoxin system RelE/ParE family toxin [Aquisalimonas sp.]|uniref:type II toxin-antitoxin system RelE/ParE family toxin n=1 Tax=Aquisalimonas sp. TaxID=1872621 RepID=UPI0025B90B78|nr:type II toxin-antitoxin system RelE/ParE family toxin [Aquisalimonas sp.]
MTGSEQATSQLFVTDYCHALELPLIVYRVDDGDVFIIRVRHGHEDWQSFKTAEAIE